VANGEPTLCPNFVEVIEASFTFEHIADSRFFKLVLITNAVAGPVEVTKGLALLSPHDEVWAKLEAGTQEYMDRVNRSDCALEKVLSKILVLGRRHL